jgi:hypothetical protein
MRTIHATLFVVTVKPVSFGFGLIAAVTGLVAAFYWYRSSGIEITPAWAASPPIAEPAEPDAANTQLTSATIQAFKSSADLNRKAAMWTAVSVLAAALSTLLSILA